MKILLADDDSTFRQRLARAIRERGHEVCEAEDGAQAITQADAFFPDAVILDLKMPHMNGLEALREIIARHAHAQVILLTGYGSIPTAMEAVRLGARDYLIKPTDVTQLLATLGKDPSDHESEPAHDLEPPSLERVEWEHIQRVLADCQGNISEAARVLGLHRRSLQRKLQKYPPQR